MLNNKIFYFFYNFAHQSVFSDKLIIFFADSLPYLVVIFIFLFFYYRILIANKFLKSFLKNGKELFFVFFAGSLAWLIAQILKVSIQAPRPFLALSDVRALFPEIGYAFPSQHTVFFTAIAMMMVFFHKKIGYGLLFSAILIGLARIIAGVHFPVDILGGFVLGVTVAYFMKFLYKKLS